MGSGVCPAQERETSPSRGLTCCFSAGSGQKSEGSPFFLALLLWQCLTPPPKLCSALERSHSQLCQTSRNLTVCAVDPCRIPSVPILLDFVPSEKSCSGFSELTCISLTQNYPFLGSSNTVKLVCLGFFPPLKSELNNVFLKFSVRTRCPRFRVLEMFCTGISEFLF